MHSHASKNHPAIINALNKIGIEALLAHLRTERSLRNWIASGGKKADEMVADMDAEIVKRSAGVNLTPENIAKIVDDVFVDTPGMNPAQPQNNFDVKHSLLVQYTVRLSYLDVGNDNTAAQLIGGTVDWQVLARYHQQVTESDPSQIAFRIILRLMDGQEDMRCIRLLSSSLGAILAKELSKNPSQPGTYLDWDERDLLHVRDWIMAAVANDAKWLNNVDKSGLPKKLAKCGSVLAMVAEADKQMKKDLTAGHKRAGDRGNVFASDDGPYYIVRLTTPYDLDIESNLMRHCIGHGAYDRLLTSEDHTFLSLRDQFGRPHATLQVVKKTITQAYGKANTVLKDEYRAVIDALLLPLGIDFRKPGDILDLQTDDAPLVFGDNMLGIEARDNFPWFFGD